MFTQKMSKPKRLLSLRAEMLLKWRCSATPRSLFAQPARHGTKTKQPQPRTFPSVPPGSNYAGAAKVVLRSGTSCLPSFFRPAVFNVVLSQPVSHVAFMPATACRRNGSVHSNTKGYSHRPRGEIKRRRTGSKDAAKYRRSSGRGGKRAGR